MLIYVGVLAVAVLPGILVALAGGETGGAALATLGAIGGLVVVVWLWIQFCLAPPALMLEKQGIVAAMKRSAKLVKGSWWRALGVQLLAIVLVYFVTSIIQLPFTFIGSTVSGQSFADFFSASGGLSWTYPHLYGYRCGGRPDDPAPGQRRRHVTPLHGPAHSP